MADSKSGIWEAHCQLETLVHKSVEVLKVNGDMWKDIGASLVVPTSQICNELNIKENNDGNGLHYLESGKNPWVHSDTQNKGGDRGEVSSFKACQLLNIENNDRIRKITIFQPPL